MLEGEKIPYMALDLDPDRVRHATAAGNSVAYGDAARLQALMAAGLGRASAVVITYLDIPGALKVLANVRAHAPNVPVIVRTQDDFALDRLRAAGATEVVPESIEGSLMLASHALALVGVPMRRVIRLVQDQRDARYNLLRGYFHGADDHAVDDGAQERLHSLTLPAGAHALGQPLGALLPRLVNARILSLRRRSGKSLAPDTGLTLEDGDTLVLSGPAEALALAEEQLLRG
jgi:CPA2 family monovalent cation:H+ antiporter-2